MRTVPSLLAMLEQTRPEPPRPSLKPWTYVRLRRVAAGLTIAQSARPYWKHEAHRADVEAYFTKLETSGVRLLKQFYTADRSRAFPFSIDIYRQLCEAPEGHHPHLCLCCGWDEWTVQPDMEGYDTTWSESDPDICTLCEQQGRQKAAA